MAPRIDAPSCRVTNSSFDEAGSPAPKLEKPATNDVCGFDGQRSFDTGYSLTNPSAAPTAQGALSDQATQAYYLSKWAGLASASHAGAPVDALAPSELAALKAIPPNLGSPTEFVTYTSHLKNVSANDAFAYFVGNADQWFGASGITLHPKTAGLTDGARLFLQEPGVTPPVWAPIEVHLDPTNRTVRITTLDGHPLRGVNQFSFSDDGRGGCDITQSSAFQLSSFAAEQGSSVMSKLAREGVPGVQDPIVRQHQIWEAAHANIADKAPRS